MSEEEKTTLEFIKINNKHRYCDKNDVDFLLNLIEKQQKELEQEKENNTELRIQISARETVVEELQEKIEEIRDKAEVMDYYTLNDVIEDLTKLLEV